MRILFAVVLVVSPAVASAAHPLTTLLKSLPEVESVMEQPGDSGGQVIIHLRDWHYVDFDSFTADLRDSDPNISDGDLDEAYRDHLRLVQAVQAEQRRLIRRLIRAGVRTVYLEGLTPGIEPVFPVICRAVCSGDKPSLTDLFELPNPLAMRSAGQLLAEGEALTIRAADSDQTLAECNPIDESGRFREVALETLERREDHMIRTVTGSAKQPVLLLLGGGHDLSNNAARVEGDTPGLIVVTTRQYATASAQLKD